VGGCLVGCEFKIQRECNWAEKLWLWAGPHGHHGRIRAVKQDALQIMREKQCKYPAYGYACGGHNLGSGHLFRARVDDLKKGELLTVFY
jgi:hypothetical protein